MAQRLLRTFPDFDKSTEEQMMALAVKLESLSPEMLRLVCNPINGIASKQAYAPTVFHIESFVQAEEARANAFKPAHTTYNKFEYVGEDPIGVEKPWEPTTYSVKVENRTKRLANKDERLKLAREKYGPKVWMDTDGWLHTGGIAIA